MALFEKIVGDVMATGFDGIPLVAGDPAERERFTQIFDQTRDAAYRIIIGVPAAIGRAGVQRVVEPELDTTGREQFARSASALRAVSEQLKILR